MDARDGCARDGCDVITEPVGHIVDVSPTLDARFGDEPDPATMPMPHFLSQSHCAPVAHGQLLRAVPFADDHGDGVCEGLSTLAKPLLNL